jgi:MFS transporter, SET family, sugar efflux transporter
MSALIKMVLTATKNRTLFVWNIRGFPVLFLTNFIFGLAMSFFAPFSSLFGIDQVGMSNIGFGIFMTIMAVGGVMISTYIGKLSDRRVSRKLLLIITSAAAILGYAGFAFFRDYYVLSLIGFFLLGTASAAVPQLWAYAREVLDQTDVPEHEIPYVMNIFRMFFALSWTVGPALAAWLLLIVGFKGLFIFVAVAYAFALLTILYLLKDVPRVSEESVEPIVLKKFVFKPHILANLVAMLLLTAATSINMLNVPQFVTKVLHGSEMHVGIIFSVPPVFEVPMMVAFGILATRFDNALLIRLGFAIATVYFLLIWNVTEPWQIYPLQILSAAQVSITSGIAVTYFQSFIPDEPGTATTLYMNTSQLGATLGYLLFGVISELLGYGNVFVVCMIFTGIGLMILLTSRHVTAGKAKVKQPKAL